MNLLKLGAVPAFIALAACNTVNSPVSSSSFDPLRPPGSSQPSSESYGPELSPGQIVSANIPNTAFYKNAPKGSADADKLLQYGTTMKIISLDSSYVKVELDSGEVGYVPSVMVKSPDMASTDLAPIDGAYQVYPPLPGDGMMEPLPIIDLGGLPPSEAIPTVIDPNAPALDPGAAPTLDAIPEIKEDKPEEPLDPVAEAVRKKVEAAQAEEAAKALKESADKPAE